MSAYSTMGDAAHAVLMSLPVSNPERLSLRDRVPYSAKKLETLTRSWLSRSPEFHVKRKAQWWNTTNRDPIYPSWTAKKTQLPCLPWESGNTCLPGMEAFAAQLNSAIEAPAELRAAA
jgi:hypothetical protein